MASQPIPDPATIALAGREREQVALRAALAAALAGRGSLVLIGGEAGIGKTTLAEDLCRQAAERGALVLIGRCYDLSETPPFGPWREALARAPVGDGLPVVPTALLPPERDDGEVLVGQDAIFRRVQAYLSALARIQPLVLLLDDLHWADPASLDLLRVVARGLADLPLLLLATYRADELTRRHPLYPLLPILVREARAERLDLRPLDHDALLVLIRARYALPVDSETRLAGYLAGRAEGNPLFTGELLRALEENGTLRPIGAAWALGDLTAVGVPPMLRQVIDARVDRLGEAGRELLALAAVIGQDVPLDLWAALGDVTDEALAAIAERAVEAHLISLRNDGSVIRFAHALIREALYEGTLPLQRRGWHRRIGETLASAPAADPDVVAHHFRQAGDTRTAEWLDRAAERARRAYAWGMATERLEAALAFGEQHGAAPGERGWLALRLGLLRRYANQRQATDLFDQAALRASEAGDPHLAAYARFEVGLVCTYVGDYQRGVADMEAAVAALDVLPPLDEAARARLHAWGLADEPVHHQGTLVLWLALTGQLTAAVALGERIVAGLGDRHEVSWLDGAFAPDALRGLGIAYSRLGRPVEAQAALNRHLASCRAAGDLGQATLTAMITLRAVVLPYRADDLAGRRRVADEGEALAARALGSWTDAPPRLWVTPLLLLEGHWDELRALVAGPIARTDHTWGQRVMGLMPLAYYQGNPEEARSALRVALPDGPASDPSEFNVQAFSQLIPIASALAQDAGNLAEARAWLVAHDRCLESDGVVLGRAEGALGWAAYLRAAGDLARAHAHAEQALAHATEPRQPLALLAAHRTLGELDTVAGQHVDAAAHLDAALALADACAAPYERALCLLALAELRAGEGKAAAATTTLSDARAIITPLGAAPALARADTLLARLTTPPPIASVAALPFGLSAREVEVLALLTEGLTDPQIAERLFVSRNTVNSHLRAIYGKLGVNTRVAAARTAAEHGLA